MVRRKHLDKFWCRWGPVQCTFLKSANFDSRPQRTEKELEEMFGTTNNPLVGPIILTGFGIKIPRTISSNWGHVWTFCNWNWREKTYMTSEYTVESLGAERDVIQSTEMLKRTHPSAWFRSWETHSCTCLSRLAEGASAARAASSHFPAKNREPGTTADN